MSTSAATTQVRGTIAGAGPVYAFYGVLWLLRINHWIITSILAVAALAAITSGTEAAGLGWIGLAVFGLWYGALWSALEAPHLLERLSGRTDVAPQPAPGARMVAFQMAKDVIPTVTPLHARLLAAGYGVAFVGPKGEGFQLVRSSSGEGARPQVSAAVADAASLRTAPYKLADGDVVVCRDGDGGGWRRLLTEWQGYGQALSRSVVEIRRVHGAGSKLLHCRARVRYAGLGFPCLGYFSPDDRYEEMVFLPHGKAGFGFRMLDRSYGIEPDVPAMLREIGI